MLLAIYAGRPRVRQVRPAGSVGYCRITFRLLQPVKGSCQQFTSLQVTRKGYSGSAAGKF